MFHDFHPVDFNEELYNKLPNLDKMRYDVNCVYAAIYKQHSQPFRDCSLAKDILPPLLNPLEAMNRQISLSHMEYAVQGIYKLFKLHEQLMKDPFFNANRKRYWAAHTSYCDLSDTISVAVALFMHELYRPYFDIALPYLQDRGTYYPSEPDEASFDFQGGLVKLYEYLLAMRVLVPTPIMISYRNDGKGRGSVFDHATMQQITGRDTVILTDGKRELMIRDILKELDQPLLQYGINENNVVRPLLLDEVSDSLRDEGLVFIPGLAEMPSNKITPKVAEDNKQRSNYERALIKDTLGRRPVLFICGGMYRLCEMFNQPIKPVKGHRGAMPHFEKREMVGNLTAHSIRVKPASKMASLLGFDKESTHLNLSVTSVHHKAVAEPITEILAEQFSVVARTMSEDKSQLDASIEAFESKGATPTALAVQFHPESALGNTLDEARQRQMIQGLTKEADVLRDEKVVNIKKHVLSGPYVLFKHLEGGLDVGNTSDADDANQGSRPGSPT